MSRPEADLLFCIGYLLLFVLGLGYMQADIIHCVRAIKELGKPDE